MIVPKNKVLAITISLLIPIFQFYGKIEEVLFSTEGQVNINWKENEKILCATIFKASLARVKEFKGGDVMKKSMQFNQNRPTSLWYMKPTSRIMLTLLLVGSLFFTACSTTSSPAIQTTAPPAVTTTEKVVLGVIKVQGGAMLERDIIPQLCKVFSLPEQEVKEMLAAASSSTLIKVGLIDFRRMEGLILPGEYEIEEGDTLKEKVSNWVVASEIRYNKLLSSNTSANNLTPAEQLSLASVINAECLAGTHQKEVATVFLNRLLKGSKLQSCVTAEYALGYQRPYLTGNDITKVSNYNTYYISGLPIGPICAISDASLQAAMSKKMDSDIFYFYYDYIQNDMFFFADYTKFQKEGSVSRQRFEDNSAVDKRAKINKQALYH
ncbi:MAG: endolytic transglycosylase MltG [Clostridiaceae bacterium]|nr:endolytic transglycosylase MltG [Clostridiaceae bacterium]